MDHERTQEKEYEQDRSVVYVLFIDVMWLCIDSDYSAIGVIFQFADFQTAENVRTPVNRLASTM